MTIRSAGPGVTVQDAGRPGYLVNGLSVGGAADALALAEGAALLRQSPALAAIECAGMGGEFEAEDDVRIALTGAPMRAELDGETLDWNASYRMKKGQRLNLGAVLAGNYGYLHVGGGVDLAPFLGSRSTHLVARIGTSLNQGDRVAVGADNKTEVGLGLEPQNRIGGGTLRIIPSVQTARFDALVLQQLEETTFSRDPRGNRMGARMSFDGPAFAAEGGLSILSEMVVPGDIQIAGDGAPFVLLNECQTTGGYPRIGTVIPADLPKIAQARAGEPIRFQFISREEALAIHRAHVQHISTLSTAPKPRIRDPHDMNDLLSYQLISGAITGDDT